MDETVVFWDVVEEHLDEAEFLWACWERCLDAPDYTLTEVAETAEERLLAQIDGLVVGGRAVRERLLVPALASDDPGRSAAAALALLISGDPAAIDAVAARLRGSDDAPRCAAERAFGLCAGAHVDDALRAVLDGGSASAEAAALSALAFRRVDPGRPLSGVRADGPPDLVAAVLRAGRSAPERLPRQLVIEALGASERAVRDDAITTGLALGIPDAWRACQALLRHADAASLGGVGSAPMLFAAIGGDPRDLEQLFAALHDPALRRAAVQALGQSGRVAAADACLPLLDDPEIGHLAAEAFAAITGCGGGAPHAPGPPEPAELIPLEEEDFDGSLVPRAEDALPRLDRAWAEAWWARERPRFDRQRRYLEGRPFGPDSVRAALTEGPMRRRHALALEIAVRTRGRVSVETRALTARQRAQLGALASVTATDLDTPLT